MTTTSDWSRLTVPAGDTIVKSQGGLTAGSSSNVAVSAESLFLGGKTGGATATVQYDLLLTTDGVSDGAWQITKGWGQSTQVDIYNVNDLANPVLLASQNDVEARGDAKTFVIAGQAESQGGPLSAGTVGPRKVFAWYAPWYTKSSWKLWPETVRTDKPTVPYDTGNQADVARVVDQASSAGIDGFLASWQGTEGIGAYSDPKFRTLLNEANQRQNFSVAVYLETRVANATHSSACLPDIACQPDPAYVEQWIEYVVQNFGNSPAYTKMDKKMPDGTIKNVPVIILYWAGDTTRDARQNGDLSPDQWERIFANLHARGIDAFYIADSVDPSYLRVFDGLNSYNPAVFSNISWFASTRSVDTKTYSLLADPTAQRKLWVGTVVPGEDTTKMNNPGVILPRNGGSLYSYMWDTMLTGNPDWMMVTSWNEYNENTHIESSMNYGSTYLDLTRTYAQRYKSGTTSQRMTVTKDRVYWADYSSYESGRLSVDFRVSNNDISSAGAVSVTQAEGDSGVVCVSSMPLPLGDIGPGSSSIITVRWSVPVGVGTFMARLWAQYTTASGTTGYYPEVPPG
jgi:hypothetical protein